MKWIVRFCLILIFLSGIYTGKGQEILRKADSLFSEGKYEESGLAYEWILYSGLEPLSEPSAVIGRVRSIKNQGLYKRAIDYIDRINSIDLNDTVRNTLIYESLLMNYLEGNFQEVQSRFLLSKHLLKESPFQQDAILLLCLSQLKTGNWEEGLKSSEIFIENIAPQGEVEELIELFHQKLDTVNAPKVLNPKTARILSMIIPGSGQVYAGYPVDGFINFSLHVLALGGAGLAFANGLYLTGWAGGFGILQKLYFGGNQRAADLAEQKNRLNKENFIQPALSFLISLREKYL